MMVVMASALAFAEGTPGPSMAVVSPSTSHTDYDDDVNNDDSQGAL